MPEAFGGFRHFHEGRHQGYAREDHFDALRHALTTREGCIPVQGEGRGGLCRFPYPEGDAFLRVYRRGGVVRHFIRETYLLQNRALDEFRIHHHLQAAGLAVPPLLGAVWQRIGPCYRGAFATHALRGESLLAALKSGSVGASVGERVLTDCGALIHGMHALGVYHADLNASNIFLTEKGPHLLDFDKAHLCAAPPGDSERARNLARLERSLKKHAIPGGAFRLIAEAYGRSPSWNAPK